MGWSIRPFTPMMRYLEETDKERKMRQKRKKKTHNLDSHSSEEVEKNQTRGIVPRPLMNAQVVVESIFLKVPYLGAV